ncbi:MAG: hypothetical protein ABSA33_01565 [Candidatus Micrarchaeaceae archaeon]
MTAASSISFSGYNWTIQKLATPTGVGSNRFWYNSSSVYVDGNGYLHLNMIKIGSTTYAAGVNNTKALGYGTYTIDVQGPINNLDKCAVFGIFTWDNGPTTGGNLYNRELDFLEDSKWCSATVSQVGSSVVQPADDGQIASQFTTFSLTPDNLVITTTWNPGYVSFRITDASTGSVLSNWVYTGSGVPTPGNAFVNINLWQFGSQIATNQQVVVKSFSFAPEGSSACSGIPVLTISPSTASPSSAVTASVSGLSNCNGATITIKDYEGCTSGSTVTTFTGSATGGSVAITNPAISGQYGYYACVNGISSAKAILTVSSTSNGAAVLYIQPTSVPATTAANGGIRVNVSGTGFSPGSIVNIGYTSNFPPMSGAIVSATSAANGYWSGYFIAPWTPGTYTMEAIDSKGVSATASFTVT